MNWRSSCLVKATTIALACGWLASHAAQAADAKGNFAVNGIGATSCAETVGAIQHGHAAVRAELSSWLMGYITALNRVDHNTFDIMAIQSPVAVTNLVLNVCSKNSKDNVEGVTNSILKLFSSIKLTKSSSLMTVSFDGKSVNIRKNTMKKLQEFLKKHKFLNGPADGNYGTETQAAIKSFQAHEKLLVNSLPDAETVIQALIIPGIKK